MNTLAQKILASPHGKTVLFSAGQAGYIIKSGSGQLLGIDLYLSDCVERLEGHIGFKRLLPKLLAPYDMEFDCLIATHPHLAHFDFDSIPELTANGRTRLFASTECEGLVSRLMMTNDGITYVKPGENYDCGDFRLHFVNCDHGSGAPDAVGVIAEVDGKRIFEAGDTCLRLDRIDEYRSFGELDVMIAPINGAYGNLSEDECAELAASLATRLTIPCHYGMFASHGGNPGLFMEQMKIHCPALEYTIMTQGEAITI